MKKFIIIPIISYILALLVIYNVEKPEVCSFYILFPILIVLLFSYLNEFAIKKTKNKFDRKTLALWSASNLALLYTAGSVLFVMLGGNYIIAIILLLIGTWDNYKTLSLLK